MAWNTGITYVSTSPVNPALLNGIGNDLRVRGADVDGGTFGRGNTSFLVLNPGTLPAAPANGMLAIDAGNVLKQYYGAAWHQIGASWLITGSDLSYIAGKVGIGTLTPAARLDVMGVTANPPITGSAVSIFRVSAQNGIVLDTGATGTGNPSVWIQVTNAANLGWVYPLALNPNGGFVGIGTLNPTTPLQVVGVPVYTNNTTASTGGLTAGAIYRITGTDTLGIVH